MNLPDLSMDRFQPPYPDEEDDESFDEREARLLDKADHEFDVERENPRE